MSLSRLWHQHREAEIGPRSPGSSLRVVYRKLRHRRSPRGQRVAAGARVVFPDCPMILVVRVGSGSTVALSNRRSGLRTLEQALRENAVPDADIAEFA